MNIKRLLLLILLFINGSFSLAQVIDNTVSYRAMNSNSYFRLYYDNDFFTATDDYYTQGINLELVTPALKNFPLSKLLLYFKKSENKYGIAVEHVVYTPTSIRHDETVEGERPFTASLFLKTFSIAVDTLKHRQLASTFDIGVMGPVAGGAQMQTSIHRWLKNIEPLGWSNQLHNDIVLNYRIAYEKNLFYNPDWFLLNAAAAINLGTLQTNVSGGFILMIGKFNSHLFSNQNSNTESKNFSRKKIHFHFYDQPQVSFIGYDATLQGGVFNHSSPYTIPSNDITRVTFQNNIGVVITIGNLYLEYYQSQLTKEFNTGKFHRWGGIRIGVGF